MIRPTDRDVRVVRITALSHAMWRDAYIAEGLFGSVSRANPRLKGLCDLGFLRAVNAPVAAQNIYVATPRAAEIVGERIAPLVAGRRASPRFLRHALATVAVRHWLRNHGPGEWRYEQQASTAFRFAGRQWEVRPDGLLLRPEGPLAVEVDMGHVAPGKFLAKLHAYEAFALSGECLRQWGAPAFDLLTITTGRLRAARLSRLVPEPRGFAHACRWNEDLRIPFPPSWS